ncbi:hypothetical protein PILCRDRAFT_815007 [Piloderma croceum F 1598]|uniref:Uncharacterized protein n=1 Tax=Piloderma croceum (strain F 1598) TaxID=765440 RepID=A0A0C3BLZ3_PILCF|nr:hypothetical protein PILCRDRAFT_815007 [Piloderma croceum F 1598]
MVTILYPEENNPELLPYSTRTVANIFSRIRRSLVEPPFKLSRGLSSASHPSMSALPSRMFDSSTCSLAHTGAEYYTQHLYQHRCTAWRRIRDLYR